MGETNVAERIGMDDGQHIREAEYKGLIESPEDIPTEINV
jgi:hypothetical protein